MSNGCFNPFIYALCSVSKWGSGKQRSTEGDFFAVAEGEVEGRKTSALEVEAEGEAEGLVFVI